jgi:transcriptional regulator with XRE-family HTH domain
VGEIERGESNVTIPTLKTIADTLQVRIRDLVGELFKESRSSFFPRWSLREAKILGERSLPGCGSAIMSVMAMGSKS